MDNNELDFFPLLSEIKQEVENQPSTSEKASNDLINAACDSVENSKVKKQKEQ